jgi:hypothetical protein
MHGQKYVGVYCIGAIEVKLQQISDEIVFYLFMFVLGLNSQHR